MPLYAGMCETDITPPLGVVLTANGGTERICAAIHDPLYARAAVLDNGVVRLAIITADLYGFPTRIADEIRTEVAKRIGTQPQAVLLCCTGITSGPELEGARADASYLDLLARKVAGVAEQASAVLEPAHLTYGDTSAQIGVSSQPDSSIGNGGRVVSYAGAVSATVQALCMNGADGKLMALLFTHACATDSRFQDGTSVSAGWPGAAATRLKERFRSDAADGGVREGALPLFLAGFGADVQPVRHGTWGAVRENGRQIGDAAHTARWSAHGRQTEDLGFAELGLDLPGTKGTPDSKQAISCIRVGGIRLLAMPAAVTVQYQLDFAERSAVPVLCVSHANGHSGSMIASAVRPGLCPEGAVTQSAFVTVIRSESAETAFRRAAYELLAIETDEFALFPSPHPQES